MSSHILLNLLKELRKSDKSEACSFSYFAKTRNESNKLNKTGA